jgi:hypothetical protein
MEFKKISTTHYDIVEYLNEKFFLDKNGKVRKYIKNDIGDKFKHHIYNTYSRFLYISFDYPEDNDGYWVVGLLNRNKTFQYIRTQVKYGSEGEVIEYSDNLGNWWSKEIMSFEFPFKEEYTKFKNMLEYVEHQYNTVKFYEE